MSEFKSHKRKSETLSRSRGCDESRSVDTVRSEAGVLCEPLEPRLLLSSTPYQPILISDPIEADHPLIDASFDDHGSGSDEHGSGHTDVDVFPSEDPFAVDTSLIQGAGVIAGSDDISGVNDGNLDLNSTFFLHSNPGAKHTIYLDFDGHVTTNTLWNSEYGISSIVTPKFNGGGGDPDTFSNSDLTMIQKIWSGVAEDFAPFNVNVTTEDPGVEALRKSGSGDDSWGIRVVMGDTSVLGNIGGVAWVGSFSWSSDTPAFALNVYTADETASHEVGHAMGLRHDGNQSTTYYRGHGSGITGWLPIMGSGSRNLSQWSKGEYAGANNQQDDLAVIANNRNGFGYRVDDHGSVLSLGSATLLRPDSSNLIQGQGIIERNTDDDVFTFTTGGGSVVIDVTPTRYNPNLDILAEIYDSDGALVASSNLANELDANFNLHMDEGQYFLKITGTGKGDVLGNGYSDYGSLGNYWISGTISNPTLDLQGDLDGDGFVDIDDVDFLRNIWNTHVTNDPSGDGYIGIDDLNLVLSNWNTGAPLTEAELNFDTVSVDQDSTLDTAEQGQDAAMLLSPETQAAVAALNLHRGSTASMNTMLDHSAWSLDSETPESLLGLWDQVQSL